MEQAQYREMWHYRQAKMKETGEMCFVDDHTFNPELHEELAVEAAAEGDKVE